MPSPTDWFQPGRFYVPSRGLAPIDLCGRLACVLRLLVLRGREGVHPDARTEAEGSFESYVQALRALGIPVRFVRVQNGPGGPIWRRYFLHDRPVVELASMPVRPRA